jgi:hypothetical protein
MGRDKSYQIVTDKNYYESVVASDQPVLLVFAAEWSGP